MKDINRLFFDIETIKAPDYTLFEPSYTVPRTTKNGEPDKRDKPVEEQKAEFLNKCAISPLTGQVAMVGYIEDTYHAEFVNPNEFPNIQDEKNLCKLFWTIFQSFDLVIGFDVKRFDFPFLIKRSYKHRIKLPDGLITHYKSKTYLSEKIIDLREMLACGEYPMPKGKLSDYQKFFGLEVKDDTISENFEKYWNEDRDKAIENNRIEVESIKQIYEIVS